MKVGFTAAWASKGVHPKTGNCDGKEPDAYDGSDRDIGVRYISRRVGKEKYPREVTYQQDCSDTLTSLQIKPR
jgi:hypothetical protein